MEVKLSEMKKVFEKEICANCIRTRVGKCSKKDRDALIETRAIPQGIWLLCAVYINQKEAEEFPELLEIALNGEILI